ncbi:MAG: hypothetical protein LBE91_05270 [Tannerella sp.]|jgi:hypothetical protein|nr:hypothetical protein [Tannerella sp.]
MYRHCENNVAYILADGPSLTNDIGNHIQLLSKKDTFVMNQFVVSDLFLCLKPKYYVLVDPVYWIDTISDTEIDFVVALVDGLKNLVYWDMTLFIPIFALKAERIRLIKENAHINIIGYSSLSLNGFRFCRNYWYKKNTGMPSPQTVLNASIFLALNSGYKEINVLGADHTFIKQLSVGYDNLIYREDSHFYDKEKVEKVAIVDGVAKDWTIERWLITVSKMFRSHYILKDYAKHLGAKIYNLTSDTLLDVYERRKIEDSF